MSKLRLASLLAALAGLMPALLRAQSEPIRFDQWLFYQENLNGSERWQYRPRIYIPFALPDGWTFTQRADLPFYYTNARGPANPDSDWSFHASDFMVEEIFDTPDVATNFRLRASLRLVAPTGGRSPFGAYQWQVAPGFGFNWRFPDLGHGVSLAPYIRYFVGFDPQGPGITEVRSLTVRPTVNIGLGERWSLIFYEEQPLTFNNRTNQWFIPLEAMFARRQNASFGYSFGGAYRIVDDNPSYRWLLQGRLTFYF